MKGPIYDIEDQKREWTLLKSEYLMKRPWLTVRREHLRLPNGAEVPEFYVLEYPDWVNVTAITEDGKMVMVKQYRRGVERVNPELAAGVIDEGETPLDAAKRELQEETGYGEGEWKLLAVLAPNPLTSTNYAHCYLAENVKRISGQHLDGGEDITVHLYEQEEVRGMLEKGEIIQALMAAPLWKYFATRNKQ